MVILYDTEFGKNKIPELVVKERHNEDSRVTGSEQVVNLMERAFRMSKKAEERLYQLALDASSKIKGIFEIGHGGRDACVVDMKNIVSNLLLSGATGMVLIHNHPSGDLCESACDVDLHEKVLQACKLMNVRYEDFLIVGEDEYGLVSYRSFRDNEDLWTGGATA